jgi:hypothetical protein
MVRETQPLTDTMPNSWQTRALGLLGLAALLPGPPLAALVPLGPPLAAQTAASPYIGRTGAQALQGNGVQLAGDVRVANGEMQLGNGSTITAGTDTVPITLNRGGELRLCSTTSIHLSRDRSIDAPDASGLMLGLDRGAIEAHYPTSKYSDVLLTPDLRILISGPGDADIAIRVSRQGDTCIDNRGPNAPYITVSSQLEGGIYRVQPGQHVSFQHGSLREVVDTEHEPCGCPAPLSVAEAGTSGATTPAAPASPVGGPSSTPADTAFPLAVSEGLTNAPLPPTTPVAAPGEVHAQVTVPLHYNGELPTVPATSTETSANDPFTSTPPPPSTHGRNPIAPSQVSENKQPAAIPPPPPSTTAAVAVAPSPPPAAKPSARRLFRRVGRFFSRLFGAES